MISLLTKALLSVLTKILISAASEAVIEYVVFTVAEEAAKSSKTKVDDKFIKLVKDGYADSK